MMGIAGCLTYEFQVTLPVMADRGLRVGATGFGFMTASMGIGAVVGGLLVAARGRTGLRPLVMAASGFAVAMGLATLAPTLALELFALALAGGEHLLHVDGQLDAAAQRRAGDARSGDVAVVRRLPGLDADRRSDRRLDHGRDRPPRAGSAWARSPSLLVAVGGLVALRRLGLPAARSRPAAALGATST